MNQFSKLLMVTYFILLSLTVSTVKSDSLACDFERLAEDKVDMKALMFSLKDVKLLDSEFKTAMDHNSQWLLELEPDRFLAWFRKEAGLSPKAEVYGGWESETVAGHSLGHYLTALALMYADTGGQ